MPTPLSVAVCVGTGELSVTTSVAVRAPLAEGVKMTLIVQLTPAARLVPHPFVWVKSAGFDPLMAMLVMDSGASPLFRRVRVCAALAVLTSWFANTTEVGLRTAPASVPVPLIGTD
jgi:hypothetical protein